MDSEPEGYVLMLKREFLDQTIDQELRLLLGRLSVKPVHYAQRETILVWCWTAMKGYEEGWHWQAVVLKSS